MYGRGSTYTSTVIHTPPSLVSTRLRVTLIFLQTIPTFFALFNGADPNLFSPGLEVELVQGSIAANNKGQFAIGYKFKMVDEVMEKVGTKTTAICLPVKLSESPGPIKAPSVSS